jgi:signal transduction histidine kinase
MRLDNASKVRLATLGQLAAQLAHEIGTPLSSVSGPRAAALRERELPPALRERWTCRRARSNASARSCATTRIRRAR